MGRSRIELDRAVVAITGGARGIGRATAEAFAAEGAKVAIGDIDAELCERTAGELERDLVGLTLDVTDRRSFAGFLDSAEERLGPLDILVNNAGIMPMGSFLDEDDALTERILAVNAQGVLTGSKLAGRRFRDRGRGHLINVSSLLGTRGAPRVVTYCATKFAIVGFSDALRHELRETGVHVTNVMPSVTRTELIAGVPTNLVVDRLGTADPEDIAAAIVKAAAADDPPAHVAVPALVGLASRIGAVLPTGISDVLFRALGAERIAQGVDDTARADYAQRTESSSSARRDSAA